MSKATAPVDGYIRKNSRWKAELEALRALVLETELTEDVKWRTPCYTLNDANVIMLGTFNACCTISFLKGALLKDPTRILELPGPNTQAARVIRFQSLDDIRAATPAVRALIAEAIAVERAGMTYAFKPAATFEVPAEFQARLDAMPELKAAFDALTPGRQRAYLMHFSSAKQSATRAARVERHIPQILAGKGIDDDYKSGK